MMVADGRDEVAGLADLLGGRFDPVGGCVFLESPASRLQPRGGHILVTGPRLAAVAWAGDERLVEDRELYGPRPDGVRAAYRHQRVVRWVEDEFLFRAVPVRA